MYIPFVHTHLLLCRSFTSRRRNQRLSFKNKSLKKKQALVKILSDEMRRLESLANSFGWKSETADGGPRKNGSVEPLACAILTF